MPKKKVPDYNERDRYRLLEDIKATAIEKGRAVTHGYVQGHFMRQVVTSDLEGTFGPNSIPHDQREMIKDLTTLRYGGVAFFLVEEMPGKLGELMQKLYPKRDPKKPFWLLFTENE